MRDSLSALCASFIENRDAVKSAFLLESAYIYPVCAAIIADKRQTADVARLRRVNDILKENTGLFSNFRGTAKLSMIAMMAVDDNPEEKLARALAVYAAFKEHFFTSQYLPVASMIVSDLAEPARYGEIAERTRNIYDLMKRDHPFLTSSEDSVFAALLALSSTSDAELVNEAERCYSILKPEFFSGNAVQSLSHVLALCEGSADDKCARIMELYRDLRDAGRKYGTSYELATLGVLGVLPVDRRTLIDDISEVDDFLAAQKGYGILGVGRKQRLMHAGMLVTSDYMGSSGDSPINSAALCGTISLIVAQQVAICSAIAATGAAAASSGSSGG